MLDSFEKSMIFEYERNTIIYKNNDELRYLLGEYRDGIMLFDLMEDSVWNKASLDSVGLQTYFTENQEKYGQESLEDIRGSVVSDFQELLEDQLVKRLRKKYKVKINKKAINEFSKSL